MTTRKPTYDAYKGVRTLENCAHALLDAINVIEHTTAMTIQSCELCPRCNATLKEIRIEPRFRRLFVFCPGCHFFLLYDRIGRIKTFSKHNQDSRPLHLPPRPIPQRPLERMISKHLNSIKKDTRL